MGNIYKIFFLLVFIWFASCRIDKRFDNSLGNQTLTPYSLSLPTGFSDPSPIDNPLSVEGIALGRKLFYDKILSANNTQACATCHDLKFGFTDNNNQFSEGLDKIKGNRNAMPLFNLNWKTHGLFWDGRSATMETQALEPIQNPIEMHQTLDATVAKLKAHTQYPALFKQVFGSADIKPEMVGKAIAQFERTMLSFNSKFDKLNLLQKYLSHSQKILNGDTNYFNQVPSSIERGMLVFYMANQRFSGHCSHCHGTLPKGKDLLFTDDRFHNNGLITKDSGRAAFTKNPYDMGFFITPSVRNLAFTAPYMHDGRLKTLTEVIDHYTNGVPNLVDPTTKTDFSKPLQLTQSDKTDLLNFLLALTDSSFIENPDFKNP